MNQFILNIMKVYCIASIVYVIYAIYLKYTEAETINDILKDDEELTNKYNKINKNRIMVFIIGIVIGLIILIISEPSISISKLVSHNKSLVEDVSDISVI